MPQIVYKSILVLAGFLLSFTAYSSSAMDQASVSRLAKENLNSLLVVNIATRCGYTSQLEDLEKLYQKYKDKGLVVIGVPSNDFGGQSPENNRDIKKFCKLNYGVSFPIWKKQQTKNPSSPLFETLIKASGGKEIAWNFEKFLLDKDLNFVQRYSSKTKPLSPEIETKIKALLRDKK